MNSPASIVTGIACFALDVAPLSSERDIDGVVELGQKAAKYRHRNPKDTIRLQGLVAQLGHVKVGRSSLTSHLSTLGPLLHCPPRNPLGGCDSVKGCVCASPPPPSPPALSHLPRTVAVRRTLPVDGARFGLHGASP